MKRLDKRRKVVALVGIVLIAMLGYTVYMGNKRLIVNKQTYQPLLNLIADVESRGNYNAYFGHTNNQKIDFTAMTINEVLQWQDEFIDRGSPSSAVGRYQFLNTTLGELVSEQGINRSSRFDKSMQDRLAIALLERRGGEAYVNKELSRHDFAANLAKEWASLPQITGDAPEKSYYDSDGLNKALVESKKVLEAVNHIEAE